MISDPQKIINVFTVVFVIHELKLILTLGIQAQFHCFVLSDLKIQAT